MKKNFIGGKQTTRKQALKGLYPVWGLESKNTLEVCETWTPNRRMWRVVSSGTFNFGPWEYTRRAAIWKWIKLGLL